MVPETGAPNNRVGPRCVVEVQVERFDVGRKFVRA